MPKDQTEKAYLSGADEFVLGVIQAERNGCTLEECRIGCCRKGVDNVLLKHIEVHENIRNKITESQS